MERLDGKRVIVVGLGRSGVAAARLCVACGARRVVATDKAPEDALSEQARRLRDLGVELICGGHGTVAWDQADMVVVSPGVPRLPEVVRLERRGVEVTGELDLATRYVRGPVVVIGGTNGKSTVTSLVGAMLAAEGIDKFFVGGNLGDPLAERASERFDWIVLEISSFQAEHVPTLHPKVATLLNITEDHLDRYPDAQAYADAKGNVFLRQTPDDVAVIPAGDEACEKQARRGRAKRFTFGPSGQVHRQDGRIVTEWGASFDLSSMKLRGGHNELNAMAAIATAHAMGLSDRAIAEALSTFSGLEHRAQLVGSVGGVTFYDDSKGTNVGAAVAALRGMTEHRAVLIAGGRDKQGSYEPLVEALRDRGRAVVLIGEAADRIAQAVGETVPVMRASSMDEAVRMAFSAARPGDAVLLSPACSSFDMFANYKVRGTEFQRCARKLIEERSSADERKDVR